MQVSPSLASRLLALASRCWILLLSYHFDIDNPVAEYIGEELPIYAVLYSAPSSPYSESTACFKSKPS